MPRITKSTRLNEVEHVLGSGGGTLDFAVESEREYYTWEGNEDADWAIEDVDCVENAEEDRFILYPDENHFICKIDSPVKEGSEAHVRCWCED